MEICDDLDDISEGEIVSDKDERPSDKESEDEVPKIIEEAKKIEDELLDEELVTESVESNLSIRKLNEEDIEDSNLINTDEQFTVKVENQEESRTKEASEALLELASCFADFGRPAAVESSEQKHDISSETISVSDENADYKLKMTDTLTNGERDYSSEATLSADETRLYENLCSDEELSNRMDLQGGSIASQLILEHSYCLPHSIRTEGMARVSSLEQKQRGVESNSDSVSRGPNQVVADHEYTKVRAESPPFVIPPSPPKVMPRRKTKLKRRRRSSKNNYKENFTEDIKQPPITQPEYTYPKRSVIEELNILYEFLRNGIDYEDTVYLQKSYDALLQDDIQGFWLNNTHWVDHPHILLSFSSIMILTCCLFLARSFLIYVCFFSYCDINLIST